jgi:ABC-2 type transport system permease protein
MHNLSTVWKFEVVRTLKKKSFWITALAFPVVISAVFAIIYFSNKTTNDIAQNMKNQNFSLAITDNTNLIKPEYILALKADRVSAADKAATIEKVKTGQLDAYFYYPESVSNHSVEIYARDVGLFDNSKYQAVASALIGESVSTSVSKQVASVLQNKVNYSSTTYKDGQPYDGIKQLIAPGLFLLLFYLLIAFFGNQMLTSTTEEKENRVIEMILTTIEARTLIIGKILSLITLAAVQIVVVLVPVLTIYLLFGSQLSLPNVDLTNIPLDGVRIAIGAVIFVLSFLFFTGLLVAIGAATPTAKEASGFFGLIMTLIFGPLYAFTLFISAPQSPFVQFLSFFPLTAPIPLMLRNAVGNLSIPEALIGIAILVVSAVVALSIAIRLFRFGALEYSRRLSLREIIRRRA